MDKTLLTIKRIIEQIWLILVKTAYPLVGTAQAISNNSTADIQFWYHFWICFSFFSFLEIFLNPIIEFLPFAKSIVLYLYLWLQIPFFHGSETFFNIFLAPFYKKNEKSFRMVIPCNISQFQDSLLCASNNFLSTYKHYLDVLNNEDNISLI